MTFLLRDERVNSLPLAVSNGLGSSWQITLRTSVDGDFDATI